MDDSHVISNLIVTFSKNYFKNTKIRPRTFPDLGPNCLQMLSADNKSCHLLIVTSSHCYRPLLTPLQTVWHQIRTDKMSDFGQGRAMIHPYLSNRDAPARFVVAP